MAEVFPFFADAANLELITPAWLHFAVATPPPIIMREGALIDYRLRLHGIPIRWRTRIDVWDPPDRFVDRQIGGPYRLWVHEHTFTPRAGGTLSRDRVVYAARGGPLVERLVRRDLERIFAHRARALAARFRAPAPRPRPHDPLTSP